MNNNLKEVRSVKEIKELIDKVILPRYSYKIDFSNPDFLICINKEFIVAAILIKSDNKWKYEFILDTHCSFYGELFYEDIKMILNIIDILEFNRKFVESTIRQCVIAKSGQILDDLKKYNFEDIKDKYYRRKI